MFAGVALGGAAIQGLHAQAKPKAYVVSELETLDPAAQAVFTPLAQAAQKAAGGRTFITGGARVVGLEGAPPLSVWSSTSSTASIRQRHTTNQKHGMTLRHNVKRQ